MEANQVVTLKDGYEAPMVAVAPLMLMLEHLWRTKPMVFFDAVMHARTGERQFNADHLEKLGLTNGGQMHEITRHVIVSAVSGDEFDMVLSSPVQVQS